ARPPEPPAGVPGARGRRPSVIRPGNDYPSRAMTESTAEIWTEGDVAKLREDFGDAYGGRTVLVTGADGFMGSHLTDALVELSATVHAFVRATSSGALNKIGPLRDRLKVHFADLTARTSIGYLV